MDQLHLGAVGAVEKEEARKIFQPSQPIRSQEDLIGREKSLARTLDALQTPGRSPFIYGVRGVGKTSLAQTAAYLVNWSGSEPIYIACTPESTFAAVVTRVARNLMKLPHFRASRKKITEVKVGTTVVHLLHRIEQSDEYLTRLEVSDAVDLFNTLAPAADQPVVVIVDELDTASAALKRDVAYLIKQIGDQECRLRFVFAGIAETTEELLVHHASASRYIATIELEPLKLGELHKIVTTGFAKLQIVCSDRIAWRIACLSDGFAHFTHLLSLKLAIRAIEEKATTVTADLVATAIADAVEDSAAFLRSAYHQAVQKYQDKYEPVLWSAADHWELFRSTEHMYEAYLRICQDLGGTAQDRKEFSSMLFQLKQKSHGCVLRSDRRSWYQFSQAMMRGYCRIIAASKGIEVGQNYMQT
jgi:Cdc6-like AAA superfamily ATPase